MIPSSVYGDATKRPAQQGGGLEGNMTAAISFTTTHTFSPALRGLSDDVFCQRGSLLVMHKHRFECGGVFWLTAD